MREISKKLKKSNVLKWLLICLAALILLFILYRSYVYFFGYQDEINNGNGQETQSTEDQVNDSETADNEEQNDNDSTGTSTNIPDNFDYKGEQPSETAENGPEALSYYEQGNTLYAQGKYEESITYYDKAIATNPYYPSFYNKKAETLIKLGRKSEAIATLEVGLTNNPGDPTLQGTYEIIQNTP